MSFNCKLNFQPEIDVFDNLERPTHVLLSGYLRHSKTFELYHNLFRALSLDMTLIPFELPMDEGGDYKVVLNSLLSAFRRNEKFCSLMVSDPYKQEMLPLVDELEASAINSNALNMVLKSNQKLVGRNVDAKAFLAGIRETTDLEFEGKSMLFFGCGGVSSAVALALSSKLSKVGLVDVEADRVNSLSEALLKQNSSLELETFSVEENRDFRTFEYLYNGTGLGKTSNDKTRLQLSPLLISDKLADSGVAFDANYSPYRTRFLLDCKKRGFVVVNGLSHMLASSALHISSVTGLEIELDSLSRVYFELAQN